MIAELNMTFAKQSALDFLELSDKLGEFYDKIW